MSRSLVALVLATSCLVASAETSTKILTPVPAAASSEKQKDIGVSTSNFIDFVRQSAKITALAKTSEKNVVKIHEFGTQLSRRCCRYRYSHRS
jgi:hypothetical protein